MRLLQERDKVTFTLWVTYVEGVEFTTDTENPTPFKETVFAKTTDRAAQNYLRHKWNDARLAVTSIHWERQKWTAPLETVLSIATQVE